MPAMTVPATRCRTCGGMRARRVLVVNRASDLDHLKPWARRFDAVQLVLTSSAEQDARLQDAIERDYLECGCSAGRLTLAAAFAGTVVAIAWLRPAFDPATWIGLGASVAALPLLVQLVVVVRARLRLRARIRALQAG